MMASFVQTGCSFTEAWGESMTFFQRALRYIQRKKSKSILLFSCFLMISTLVLCSVMVLQTAQATEQSIREKTGSKLVLENIQGNNGITSDTVTQAMELPSVTKINRISSGLAYPYDFSPVIIRDGTDAINLAVTLHAYDSTEIDGPFAQEKYRLLDGQHIGETQSGILVNSILADANQLGIGDRITLATETGESVSGEIIGIFFSGIERKQDDSIASAYRVENQIFVSHDLFSVLYGTEGYSTVAIYTDNPDTLEDLWEQIELLINDSISITSSDTLYRQMQAPLEQVIRITTLMLALIVITAVIVISLLLCMWTRTRTKEMAVLISLGFSKGNLLMQSMTESIILFVLSVIGASAISSLFAKNLMDSIFSSGDFASVQNVHLEGQHLIMLLMIGSMIVLVAVGISIFPTQRANPRDTLSKMEG